MQLWVPGKEVLLLLARREQQGWPTEEEGGLDCQAEGFGVYFVKRRGGIKALTTLARLPVKLEQGWR